MVEEELLLLTADGSAGAEAEEEEVEADGVCFGSSLGVVEAGQLALCNSLRRPSVST